MHRLCTYIERGQCLPVNRERQRKKKKKRYLIKKKGKQGEGGGVIYREGKELEAGRL